VENNLMGYSLTAFLGHQKPIQQAQILLNAPVMIALPQSVYLIPVILTAKHSLTEVLLYQESFYALPQDIVDIGLQASIAGRGRIAWLEAEFFGGMGHQALIMWERGEIVRGPKRSDSHKSNQSVFNQALRELGVKAQGMVDGRYRDEFETVELGQHRHTEDWLKQIT
jgi:hypothetical protein